MKNNKLPYLLSPAGSYDALCAAISAGADEVYFGASLYNARAGAKNFSQEEFKEAFAKALDSATMFDERIVGVLSTKETL